VCSKSGSFEGKLPDFYEQRPFYKVDWLDQSKALSVCSWASFLKIWKDQFPLKKIRAPSCDVCGECYIYKNAFSYKAALVPEDTEDEGKEVALVEQEEEEEFQHFTCGLQQGRIIIADFFHKDDTSVGSDAS
jgi:hypothetical protein